MDLPRRFGASHGGDRCGLLGSVSDLSSGHDLAHRNPRLKTGGTLDKDAADSALGRHSVSNLAGEFHENVNSLA